MVKVGDKVRVRVYSVSGRQHVRHGEVVWVHPQGRFVRVEYRSGGALLRGAFAMDDVAVDDGS